MNFQQTPKPMKKEQGMSEESKSLLDYYLYESDEAKDFWKDVEEKAAKYEVTVDYYLEEFC